MLSDDDHVLCCKYRVTQENRISVFMEYTQNKCPSTIKYYRTIVNNFESLKSVKSFNSFICDIDYLANCEHILLNDEDDHIGIKLNSFNCLNSNSSDSLILIIFLEC